MMATTPENEHNDERFESLAWKAARYPLDARAIRGRRWGRFMALIWLVYLAVPAYGLLQSDISPVRLALALSGVALFIATYAWAVQHAFFQPTPARERWAIVVILCALTVMLTVVCGNDWNGLNIFVVAATAFLLPDRAILPVVSAVLALMAVMDYLQHATLAHTGAHLFQTGMTFLAIIGVVQLLRAITRLRAAREELARLAVAEERLRFARDLHDLLGHSLSLITLKSELAGRLIPTAPDRAAAEIHDIERVAREALREVREAVSGYRQPTLAAELVQARSALDAAGISCTVEGQSDSLPAPDEAILAWAVREGVTNVIRHSGAKHCTIRFTPGGDDGIVLEVIDDGQRHGEARTSDKTGSGLPGLAERVAARGGEFEAGTLPSGGFRLSISLPCSSSAEPRPFAKPGEAA